MRSASPGPGPSTLQRRQEAIQRQIKRWSKEYAGTVVDVVQAKGMGDMREAEGSRRRKGLGAFDFVEREIREEEDRRWDSGQGVRDRVTRRGFPVGGLALERRQESVAMSGISSETSTIPSYTSAASNTSSATTVSSTSTGNGLYGTSLTATATSTPLAPVMTNSISTTVNAGTFTASWTTGSGTGTSSSGSTTALTGPTTTAETSTANTSKTSSSAQYVPTAGVALVDGANGLVLNMTLNGDSPGEAVYAVPVVIGHHESKRRRRSTGLTGRASPGDEMQAREKRSEAAASDYQSLMLQVDLGSSDMWVAASTCTDSVCEGKGVTLYNAGYSLDVGASANLTYQAGFASGEIYWDEVQIGVTVDQIVTAVNGTGNGGASGFDIGAQAFVAANQVVQEDLSGGVFSGLLGLALPANSIISEIIPGTYGSSPDGATFLDNLFASGTSAPNGRYFTLSLERDGDTRTRSSFGIGMYDDYVCPEPCSPSFNSLVSSSAGPLYWRMLLQGITYINYTSPTSSTSGWSNPSSSAIPMSTTATNVLGTTVPVAVLDSGGSQMLFANRALLDSIYAKWDVTMSSDGYYYVPCDTPMMLSFQFNGIAYPVHPLDMSDYYTGTTECIGSLQYGSGLAAGDIVLGSSFLKNAYTVLSYPSVDSSSSSWSPQVGLVSLTNSSVAAQEFYNVRSLQEPIASATVATSGPSGSASQAAAAAAGSRVVSVGVIAAVSVVGLIGLVVALVCVWFFFVKRKRSKNAADGKPVGGYFADDKTDGDSATQRQSKKSSMFMARQKSMIDGYSDFETLSSWPNSESKTDMAFDEPDQMHLVEELGTWSGGAGVVATPDPGHHRRRPSNWESSYPPIGWTNNDRGVSSSRSRSPGQALTFDSPSVQNFETTDPSPDLGRALVSPTGQPLIRLVSERQDKDKSRLRRQSVGSVFEMEQMGYAKQLARHARDDSSGSGTFIPMASPSRGGGI